MDVFGVLRLTYPKISYKMTMIGDISVTVNLEWEDKAFSGEEQEEIMEGHTVIDQEEERTYRMLEKRIHGMMELGKQAQDFDGSVDKLIEE